MILNKDKYFRTLTEYDCSEKSEQEIEREAYENSFPDEMRVPSYGTGNFNHFVEIYLEPKPFYWKGWSMSRCAVEI